MPPRATFRDVFAVREFRALWFSEILSVAGDRLALVALTLLVFNHTGSPLLTAMTYAAGYLPWVIGGLFLGTVADRHPRRSVMVVCDVVRTVLIAAMAVRGVPIGVLVALLFAATMFAPPFESARAAITPDIVPGELYPLGAAVIQTTFLAGQVLGAVGGGLTVAFIGVRPALIIDAATFVLSALFIGLGIKARPAAETRRRSVAAAGPDAGRLRAALRRSGDAYLAAVRLAGGVLHDSRGGGGPVCEGPRGRAESHQPGHQPGAGVHGVQHDDRHAAVHPGAGPPAPAAGLDGAASRADLRDAGPDGPPPWVLLPRS